MLTEHVLLRVDGDVIEAEVALPEAVLPDVIRWRDRLYAISHCREAKPNGRMYYSPARTVGLNWDPSSDGVYR